jgi:hypothetical protein
MQNTPNKEWGGEISNSTDLIVQSAIQLYSNSDRWQTAQQAGFNIVQSRYIAPHSSQIALFAQLTPLIEQPDTHRQMNFIGLMLNHHHHKSTQYMAQWIEAKNRDPK